MTKFDWLASESGPKNFPMQVVQGHFHYVDGGRLYVPDGRALYSKDWGFPASTHIVGADLKPLPNRLDILFFSYTEDQFYKGSFDLPYDEILSLFQQGFINSHGNKETYNKIVAGIAPGGVVAVWLTGGGKTIEVFKSHADKSDEPWSLINDNPQYTRKKYIELMIIDSMPPEAIQILQQQGPPIGRWDQYHKQYHWRHRLTGLDFSILSSVIHFYNGERKRLDTQLKEGKPFNAVPRYLSYYRKSTKNQPGMSVDIYFNDEEIFAAFEQLTANSNAIIELQVDVQKAEPPGEQIKLYLHQGNQTLKLKKTKIEVRGTI